MMYVYDTNIFKGVTCVCEFYAFCMFNYIFDLFYAVEDSV